MQLILDVMEAYTDHLGLPLTLIKQDDDIIYAQQESYTFLTKEIRQHLVQQIQALQRPTVLSVTNICMQQDLFYMVTPKISINKESHIVIAGPYLLINHVTVDNYLDGITYIHAAQVASMMERFKNLYFILTTKSNVESNILLSKEMIEVLQFIDHLQKDELERGNLLEIFIQQLYKLRVIDFAGYATYCEEGLYEIRQVVGQNVAHLEGKQFYLGEGILGQAFFKKESFFWEKKFSNTYVEFFHRHNLQPEQLIGIPIMTGEYSNTIIFGGSFTRDKLHQADLLLLNKMFVLITQKLQWNREIKSLYNTQDLLRECLLLVDTFYETPKNHLALKLLEFCEKLNNKYTCCLTLPTNQIIVRNGSNEELLRQHRQFYEEPKQLYYTIQQHGPIIHFDIKEIGTYTVDFSSKGVMYNEMMILTSLLKLLFMLNSKKSNVDNLFEQYYVAMQELNIEKFNKVQIALCMIKALNKQSILDNYCVAILTNLVKVLPYSAPFVRQHFQGTTEYKIFEQLQSAVPLKVPYIKLETKFLAFIDQQLFQTYHFQQEILSKAESIFFKELMDASIAKFHKRQLIDDVAQTDDLFVRKEKIHDAVQRLPITTREKQVLVLMIEGLSNLEIAERLSISIHTVKNHITNIFKKLDVADRYHAMKKVLQI